MMKTEKMASVIAALLAPAMSYTIVTVKIFILDV